MRPDLPRCKLMIPGPVEVDGSVLEAMGGPVPAHYGPEWTALYKDVTSRLQQVFRTAGDIFLLVASGSGGLEAAIGSLFAPGEKVLVGVNGFFGERMAGITRSRGLDAVVVEAPWGEPIRPEAVRAALVRNNGVAGLVVTHHESSTGVLNPVRELAATAAAAGLPVVVDAVSTLGGEELAMDEWAIDVCVTASQKCLEAPPGLAPVAVSQRAWEIMDRKGDFPAGWYLNLRVWRRFAEEWGDWHPFPITMATNNVLGLRAALDILLAEGLESRLERYRRLSGYLRDGLKDMGFSLFVEGPFASSTLTAVRRTFEIDVADLIGSLLRERGIRIAGGLGPTKGEIFRIGHMGRAATLENAALLLETLRDYVHEKQVKT